MQTYYKMKFYLNGSHALESAELQAAKHYHTWELSCELTPLQQKIVKFGEIEQCINTFLAEWHESYLNLKPPFNEITPTLENVAKHFFAALSNCLVQIDVKLLRLEIGESPTRFYGIQA